MQLFGYIQFFKHQSMGCLATLSEVQFFPLYLFFYRPLWLLKCSRNGEEIDPHCFSMTHYDDGHLTMDSCTSVIHLDLF